MKLERTWRLPTKVNWIRVIILVILLMVVVPLGIVIGLDHDRGRHNSKRVACVNNLMSIKMAKQAWALETKAAINSVPAWKDIQPYFISRDQRIPECGEGGVYTIGAVSNAPTCSVKGHVLE